MLPLKLILLALPFTALAAPIPSASADPTAIKPIFGSWGESCKPFKPGKLGDKWNPPPPPPPPVYRAPPPPPPPVSTPPAPPVVAQPPAPQEEPSYGQAGQKQAKESAARSDVTRMAASNSVALFNGIPVDPMTGRPIVPPAEDEDEEPGTLTKRGLLKKKLGLQFLDDPNADENVIREAMNSQLIGTGLAAPKGTFDEQSETVDELADAAAAAESAAPAAATPEVPKKPKIQPWNSNSYMICNGVPVAVDGDVTNKALEVAKFTGPATSSLQKRGDIRNKFGFGMFDMPSVSGRRKTTQAPPAEDEEEYQEEEVEVVEEEEPAAVPAQKEKEAILPHPSQTMDEARGLPFDELPQGKSFVIYNGKPVEVNGSPFNGAKIKKPRPAFRGSRDNDYSRLAKRDPGRKYTGLNPFKPNPITGCHKDSRLSATSNDNGETNQERQEHHIEELSPHTTEQESINVKVGDSYALFNGRPIELAGKKPTPTPAPAPAEKQHPASLASGGMGFFNGMSA